MKLKRSMSLANLFLLSGLLMNALAVFMSRVTPSDFLKGTMMGFGLGLEIMALILTMRNKARYKSCSSDEMKRE